METPVVQPRDWTCWSCLVCAACSVELLNLVTAATGASMIEKPWYETEQSEDAVSYNGAFYK
ncbi:hypothetical protein ACIKK6_30665, partial [Bacillus thuringiensis]|uniref:hypothetical protein n=1 Tax=Bacillus thuringiensis TaxID=1428 RepID=UPI0037D4FED1